MTLLIQLFVMCEFVQCLLATDYEYREYDVAYMMVYDGMEGAAGMPDGGRPLGAVPSIQGPPQKSARFYFPETWLWGDMEAG